MATVGELLVEIKADSSEFKAGLENAKSQMKIAGGAIVAGAVAIGGAILTASTQSQKGLNQIQSATGASADEMENYRKVMDNVKANNYGDDFEDIANTISLVEQQIDGLSDEGLQNVVESAYIMRDVFDQDINESIRGADALMQQFELDSEQAFNLMAQGAQNGLNQNKDLADQLAEYSVLWKDLGFSAEEMFNALVNGSEDGAYQIDFLNDAIKEFGIRTKDNSKLTNEAFSALGLDADKFGRAFAEGGDEARDAFEEVVDLLWKMEDPLEQNEIGVALFGTKFEDLGVDAIKALTNTQGEISNTVDALGAIEDVKYDDLGSNIEKLKNQFAVLFSGGDIDPTEIVDTAGSIATDISEIFANVVPILVDMAQSPEVKEAGLTMVKTIGDGLADGWENLNIDEGFKTNWESFAATLVEWISGTGDRQDVKDAWGNVAVDLMDGFVSAWDSAQAIEDKWSEALKNWITETDEDLREGTKELGMSILYGIGDGLSSAENWLQEQAQSVVDGLNNIFNAIVYPQIETDVSGLAIGATAGLAAGLGSTTNNTTINYNAPTTNNRVNMADFENRLRSIY